MSIIQQGAFYTKEYRNLFKELGYSEADIDARLERTWTDLFYGAPDVRIYYPLGDDKGYILDTGNQDVRTEGMSYGMMMAVQMNKKEEFDRLWNFSKTFMQHREGRYAHYFAWHCKPDGTRISQGPAPDGEEYFAMALFFAASRWGDGPEPYNYSEQARTILRACLHQGEAGDGDPMWDPETKLIKFVPESPFSDPSYHLPHFYDLFALRADERDSAFWKQAADASRAYLHAACHPETGLAPNTRILTEPRQSPSRMAISAISSATLTGLPPISGWIGHGSKKIPGRSGNLTGFKAFSGTLKFRITAGIP